MDLVEDFAEPGVSLVASCASVGASRATLYRGTRPVPPRAPRQRAPNPRRLGDDERQAIVDAMHSPEFVDQPPMEVFAKQRDNGPVFAEIEASDVAVQPKRISVEAPCSQAALLMRHFEADPTDSQSSDLAELLPSPSVPPTVTPGGPVVARLAFAGGCVTVLERRADQVRVLIDREDECLCRRIR
jgi:hypothetical protein